MKKNILLLIIFLCLIKFNLTKSEKEKSFTIVCQNLENFKKKIIGPFDYSTGPSLNQINEFAKNYCEKVFPNSKIHFQIFKWKNI